MAAATKNAIDTLRNRVPPTRETSGRAISIRSANSPIAAITERKTAQRAIRSGGVAAVSEIEGITNCGAGSGVRADRERERSSDRVAVDRDHPPVDEVPALGQLLQRDDERVGVGRRPPGRPGRLLGAGRIRDRHDRETRLDRLAVGERDLPGRAVHDPARRGHRPQERGVRPRCGRPGEHRRQRDEDRDSPAADGHASERPPFRESRPTIATTSAAPPRISATIASVELPPPPSELFASIVGEGESELSGPDQSTTEPSE